MGLRDHLDGHLQKKKARKFHELNGLVVIKTSVCNRSSESILIVVESEYIVHVQ